MNYLQLIPNISIKNPNKLAAFINTLEGIELIGVQNNTEVSRSVFNLIINSEKLHTTIDEILNFLLENNYSIKDYQSSHPHIGLLDVIPIIPYQGISEAEALKLTNEVSKKISEKYQLPIFLYGKSASNIKRTKLSFYRNGGIGKLRDRIESNKLKADFGDKLHKDLSGVLIGVEAPYIAYNVNLKTKDLLLAKEIAYRIRASGYPKNYICNKNIYQIPSLEAIGWYLNDLGICQISTNILDTKNTCISSVYEKVKELALEYNIEVQGSEVIGIIPRISLLKAGRYYNTEKKELSEKDFLELAINHLGLNQLQKFDMKNQILENKILDLNIQNDFENFRI